MSLDQFILKPHERDNNTADHANKDFSSSTTNEVDLTLDSNPNNFMQNPQDSVNYADAVQLQEDDIDRILYANKALTDYLELEGKKLFNSFFSNRQRHRKLHQKNNKRRKSEYTNHGSDSEDSGEEVVETEKPWLQRLGANNSAKLHELSPADAMQFRNYPHMPLHSYSLGGGFFVSDLGYKPYPNATHQFRLGKMSFSSSDTSTAGGNNSGVASLFASAANINPELQSLFNRKRSKAATELAKISTFTNNVPMTAIPSLVVCLLHLYKQHIQACKVMNLPESIKTSFEKPPEAQLPPIQHMR